MRPDADGRFTYVISIADPGVHNWLDTTALHDVLVLHRWQGFPDPHAPAPAIESRKVKLAELAGALPPGNTQNTCGDVRPPMTAAWPPIELAFRPAQVAEKAADR